MKKQLKLFISFIVVVLICVYLFMVPTGALRFGIALSGHPIKSVTSKIVGKSYEFYVAENQIGYSLENPPYEKETDSQLINWVVTKHWVFYTADYFGWG